MSLICSTNSLTIPYFRAYARVSAMLLTAAAITCATFAQTIMTKAASIMAFNIANIAKADCIFICFRYKLILFPLPHYFPFFPWHTACVHIYANQSHWKLQHLAVDGNVIKNQMQQYKQ